MLKLLKARKVQFEPVQTSVGGLEADKEVVLRRNGSDNQRLSDRDSGSCVLTVKDQTWRRAVLMSPTVFEGAAVKVQPVWPPWKQTHVFHSLMKVWCLAASQEVTSSMIRWRAKKPHDVHQEAAWPGLFPPEGHMTSSNWLKVDLSARTRRYNQQNQTFDFSFQKPEIISQWCCLLLWRYLSWASVTAPRCPSWSLVSAAVRVMMVNCFLFDPTVSSSFLLLTVWVSLCWGLPGIATSVVGGILLSNRNVSRWRESQSGGLFPVLIYCPSLLFHSCATCWCAEVINVAIKLFFVNVLDFLHEFPVTVYVCYWLEAFVFSPAVFCFLHLFLKVRTRLWFVQKVTFALFYFETRIISEMHIYISPPWDCLFVCLLWRERNINVNLFSYTDDGIKEETFTVSGLLLLFLLSATWRRSMSELILPLYSTQSDKYSKRRALMTWT